jgi:hypothetical protein
MKPKKELIRIVKNKEGNIFIDKTGKQPGRGAYICPSNECFEKIRKTKKLEKSLGVKIDEDIYRQMGEELSQGGE